MSAEQQVRDAADALVADFAAGRVEDYFDRLAPEATFVFYAAAERLASRAAYRALWDRWVAEDGFRIVSCVSSGQVVQLLSDGAAVLSHDVATRVSTHAGEEDLRERESIVFVRTDDVWLVVHEHLSAAGS